MFGQKARKRFARQSEGKDKRCDCGNFSGSDGLCNACRNSKTQSAGRGPSASKDACRTLSSFGKSHSRADAARAAVLENCPEAVESSVVDYLADTASMLFEDDDMSPTGVSKELENIISPILEEYATSQEDVVNICRAVLDAALLESSCALEKAAAADCVQHIEVAAGPECLFKVSHLMLMYGGSPEPLLKDTTLEVIHGHRYGIVGANGSGKTTLMGRLASKDILGLPATLEVVHLKHDKILDEVAATTTAQEYARQCVLAGRGGSESKVCQALSDVGFDDVLLSKSIGVLSGGWQMRLALACALANDASLLLLDEPTNHLDSEGQKWLVDFINGMDGVKKAAIIVSHDAGFLDKVCTDIVHFTGEGKLAYHPGNFSEFKRRELHDDHVKAQQLLETTLSKVSFGLGDVGCMSFPAPGKTKKGGTVLSFNNVSFQYPEMEHPVLSGISVELRACSRVGIVGSNGSGKSTLLKLIAQRLKPTNFERVPTGEAWRLEGLRLAYVAQHSLTHQADYVTMTPLEYIQLRFRRGVDMESPNCELQDMSKQETERLMFIGTKHGKCGKNVEALLSRLVWVEGNETKALYEVKWKDLDYSENTFESPARLKQLGVIKLQEAFDEQLLHAWGGGEPRPLSTFEIVKHLDSFGLSEEITCSRQISKLSSGQRCKLAFGAAFWTRPHVLCLDEPTNYLDAEMVLALTQAIRSFRGCCVVVSHNRNFIQNTCSEVWELKDGHAAIHDAASHNMSPANRKTCQATCSTLRKK